jgi:hypothetical protein
MDSMKAGTFGPTSAADYLHESATHLAKQDELICGGRTVPVDPTGESWKYQKDFPYSQAGELHMKVAYTKMINIQACLAIAPNLMQFVAEGSPWDECLLRQHVSIVEEINKTSTFEGTFTTQKRWHYGATFVRHYDTCTHCCCRDCTLCELVCAEWSKCCQHCPECHPVESTARASSALATSTSALYEAVDPEASIIVTGCIPHEAETIDFFSDVASSFSFGSAEDEDEASKADLPSTTSKARVPQAARVSPTQPTPVVSVVTATASQVSPSRPSAVAPVVTVRSSTSLSTSTIAKQADTAPASASLSVARAAKQCSCFKEFPSTTRPYHQRMTSTHCEIKKRRKQVTAMRPTTPPPPTESFEPAIEPPTSVVAARALRHPTTITVMSGGAAAVQPLSGTLLKSPSTPSRGSATNTAPPGPARKRQRVLPLRTVCDFGVPPAYGSEQTFSALLVPFIHAVINRVSTITNEAPLASAHHFKFGFTSFPIRARHPVEFDAVVNGYARAYIMQGITRSFVSDTFCQNTGKIANDDQERLTDPKHSKTLIPNILHAWYVRLCALAL